MSRKKRVMGLLTGTELEMMKILWSLGEGTVNDVLAGLPKGRPLAYTSVSTILRILEQKDVLTSRKEGRGHVYVPRVTREQYEARSVGHLVEEVFDGGAAAMVKSLLDSRAIDGEELKKIREPLGKKA